MELEVETSEWTCTKAGSEDKAAKIALRGEAAVRAAERHLAKEKLSRDCTFLFKELARLVGLEVHNVKEDPDWYVKGRHGYGAPREARDSSVTIEWGSRSRVALGAAPSPGPSAAPSLLSNMTNLGGPPVVLTQAGWVYPPGVNPPGSPVHSPAGSPARGSQSPGEHEHGHAEHGGCMDPTCAHGHRTRTRTQNPNPNPNRTRTRTLPWRPPPCLGAPMTTYP